MMKKELLAVFGGVFVLAVMLTVTSQNEAQIVIPDPQLGAVQTVEIANPDPLGVVHTAEIVLPDPQNLMVTKA